ncbi:MAG: TolC family protein [Myxococcaceae bacterium]
MSTLLPLVLCAVAAATPIRLEEARAAARRNTEALRAELDARSAGEQVRLSRSAIYPHLSIAASGTGTVTSEGINGPGTGGTNSDYRLALTVTQLLYDGGRWWNQISQSGAQADAAAGQAQEQQLSSELEAVRRFYALYAAQRSLAVLKATATQSAEQLDRANALFEAGRAQKREAIAAEVNLGNDRMAVLRQGQGITAAQVDLAVWLTRSGFEPFEAEAPPALAQPPAAPPTGDEVLAAARAHRPLYRALDQQLKAAELGVSLASATYYPQVSLYGEAGRRGPYDPFLTFSRESNLASGRLEFSWPFFTGFSTDAQVNQARHSRSTAELNLEQAQRELEGDVRRTLAALSTQLEVVKIAVANRALAEKGLFLARDRFDAGAGSTLDVRDAQLKLTQSELVALQSRIDVEVARAAVERVMGLVQTGEKP